MNRENTIQKIEEELLQAKPWYEKGEVTVKERPKNSLLIQPARKTKTKPAADYFDEEGGSDEFTEKIEFIRSKTTLKICTEMERMLEQVVQGKIKEKAYDNPRRQTISERKDKAKAVEAAAAAPETAEERAPLHDVYEGRRTENDKFMEKSQLVALLSEIDRDLAEISDCTYVATRPISVKKDSNK